jgi:hypothetical protein
MCIARFIVNGIGSRAKPRHLLSLFQKEAEVSSGPLAPARPLRLQVVGEKPVEGHPAEAGQARMQASIHVKVVGLLLVQRGVVSTCIISRT